MPGTGGWRVSEPGFKAWGFQRKSAPEARSQGQEVRSTKGIVGNEDLVGCGGGSHSVISSPWSRRARKQRTFFDGSQHAPSFLGPSAQRVRTGLEGRGQSDWECGHVRRLPRPHPPALGYYSPSHNHVRLQSAFVRRSSFAPLLSLHRCRVEWVGGWRKPLPLKLAGFTYTPGRWGWGSGLDSLGADVRVEVGVGGPLGDLMLVP